MSNKPLKWSEAIEERPISDTDYFWKCQNDNLIRDNKSLLQQLAAVAKQRDEFLAALNGIKKSTDFGDCGPGITTDGCRKLSIYIDAVIAKVGASDTVKAED